MLSILLSIFISIFDHPNNLFFRYTLNEVIDIITNKSDNDEEDSEDDNFIAMLPPSERADAQTDCDSDASDDMNEGLTHHLPRRLLNANAETNLIPTETPPTDCIVEAPSKRSKKSVRKWRKKCDIKTDFNKCPQMEYSSLLKNEVKKPLEAFKKMFSSDFLTLVTEETNRYSIQNGNENLSVSENEIMVTIAILLLSGYCRVPYRDHYWSKSPDTHNEAVSAAMSRNRYNLFENYVKKNFEIER